MTTSKWDDKELRSQFADCRTLRDVIIRIESDFATRGEVICEIKVNGVVFSELDEKKYAERSADEIVELAIRSNKPADLIQEALDSALVFVPELEKSCLKTAEAFRGADLAGAQKSFHESLEGCQWLVDTLMHIRGAASGIQAPIAEPERWFEAEKIIAKVVRELSDSYSKSDFVLVADLLEYELTGSLSIWKDALRSEVAKRAQMVSGEAIDNAARKIGSDDKSQNSLGGRR